MKKIKTFAAALTVLILCVCITGCGGKSDMTDRNYTAMADSISANGEPENSNVIFSPYSLNMCMALVMNGTEGDSLSQLEAFAGKSRAEMNKAAEEQIGYYRKTSKILVSNSIWGNSGSFEFDPEYVRNVDKKLDAKAESLDFSSPDAADRINSWCSRKTSGLIPNIVDADTLRACEAILTNALYFKSAWSKPYYDEDVKAETFFNGDGTTSEVEMMSSVEEIYFENDRATGFLKSYDGNGLYFAGILPKKEGSFNMADLDIDGIVDSIRKENESDARYEVTAEIPKFEVETEADLADMMKDRGVTDIFDSAKADFAKLGKNTEGNSIFISEVKQKAKLKLDENGSEAAAVTGAMMKATALPPQDLEKKEVILNRPFAFLIYDMEQDVILFEGKITNFE